MPKPKRRVKHGAVTRTKRGVDNAVCGFREECRLREVLFGLDNEALRVALASVKREELRPLLMHMGITPNLHTHRGRQLFRTRLRQLPQEVQHYAIAIFGTAPIDDIRHRIGMDIEDEEELQQLNEQDLDVYAVMRDSGLSILAAHWPRGFGPLVLEKLWDLGEITNEQRDELLAAVNDPAAVAAPTTERPPTQADGISHPAPASATAAPRSDPLVTQGAQIDVASAPSLEDTLSVNLAAWRRGFKEQEFNDGFACGDGRSWERALEEATPDHPATQEPVPTALPVAPPRAGNGPAGATPLDSLLAQAVDIAEATGSVGTELYRLTAALECAVALDPSRNDLWRLYGRVVAMWPAEETFTTKPPASEVVGVTTSPQGVHPALPGARLEFLRGQLQTLAVRGEQDRVAEIVTAHREEAEKLLRLNPGISVSSDPVPAAILTAHLRQPRQAARLLQRVTEPFGSWPEFMGAARTRATELLAAGGAIEAEILLRAVEATLWQWAARPDRPGRGLEREATEVALLRAVCRRHRRDFAGVLKLLQGIELELLGPDARAVASREIGLAIAEVTGLEAIAFPRRSAEAVQLRGRLTRARPHLEAAVDGDAGGDGPHLIASILLGVLAVYTEDDFAAANYLGTATPVLAEQPVRELGNAVAFHAALARLRLLEPGTDEAAFHEMLTAIAAGYSPADTHLLSAAEALEAHGSPHAGAFLATAISSAPNAPDLLDLLADQARRGDPAAAGAAEERAHDSRLSLATRYMLLDAVLDGAGRRNDLAAAGRLADEIDEVLVRAGDLSLDDRWAKTLETNEALRLALEPAHADAELLEVLRRMGRMDEARAIAKSLFYRAANGTLRAFDARDLADLLAELGTPGEELADLERLVHVRSDSEPTQIADQLVAPLRVIFVGGTEVQEHYVPHLEAVFAERYRGMVEVNWFMTGWGSNWSKAAERIEVAYEGASVVVIMTFVRTNLGRWTRRTAGEHGLPWLSCTGHGRGSLERAIDRAVAVAVEQAALDPTSPGSLS